MRRFVIIAAVALLLIIGIVFGINYLNSFHSVTVTYKNAHDVTVTDDADSQDGGKPKTIQVLSKSGQSVRVPKTASYSVTYKGDTGYSDGVIPINSTDSAISITPDYSVDKYKQLISSESKAIIAVIMAAYPKAASLYDITPEALYDYGNWALASFTFTGTYSDNSDTLKIILHKKDSAWTLATKPELSFSKYSYPDIPRTILDTVNDTVLLQSVN